MFIARLPVRRIALSYDSLSNFAGPPCDSLTCEREIVVRTSYGCFTFSVILSKMSAICLRVSTFCPHAQIARSYVTHDWCETGFKLMWNWLNELKTSSVDKASGRSQIPFALLAEFSGSRLPRSWSASLFSHRQIVFFLSWRGSLYVPSKVPWPISKTTTSRPIDLLRWTKPVGLKWLVQIKTVGRISS